ncbi:myosin-14 [Electrophorus electricus]|uniref:myosin-14 n=1 Tax=Electrophorus electricus TaxID=8005 RepID=UPI0015CF9082|nr:myosin-14 [Electrophorus electricus]
MDNASSQMASEEDSGHVMDHKSQKIAELDQLVKRLRNALVSLEEDNLNLNRQLKERHKLSCPDLGLRTQDKGHLDRCGRLDVEKLEEEEASQRRVECKGKEPEAKIKRLARGCGDVPTVNKTLERRNRQLFRESEIAIKHAQLCGNSRQSGEAEEPDLEKQKLAKQVVQLQADVTRSMKELRKVRPLNVEDGCPGERVTGPVGGEPETVALLRRENRALRESLEQSRLALRKAEPGAGGGAEGRAEELERCLIALQMEKDLLRKEVRTLHQEYISLVDSVASQLRDTTSVRGTPVPEPVTEQKKSGGKELLVAGRSPGSSEHHSPTQRSTVGKRFGDGMTEQIRVLFEEA